MTSSAREKYLATEVLTAPPQKLQLMLVEAAIRFVERARQHWRAKQPEQGTEALVRAEDILGELMAGLKRDIDSDLVGKTAAVYLFVFRSLMEANFRKDEGKLDDALRVLEVERDTWRQVCARLGPMAATAKAGIDTASFREAPSVSAPHAPPLTADPPPAHEYSGGFSLDA
jgi:flagellar protein FliS